MNASGSHVFAAPRERVFEAIRDPRVLVAVIPGCQGVDRTGPDTYEGRIILRLPGAVGTYRTVVRLVDVVEPAHAGLEGRVEGAMGSISGRADFSLEPAPGGGTAMTYAGTGRIDGPLARLDGGLTERLASSLLDQGLRALDARLESGAAEVAEPRQPDIATDAQSTEDAE